MRGRWRVVVVGFGQTNAVWFGTVPEAEDYCTRNNISKGQISKWWVSGPLFKNQVLTSLNSTGFIIPNFLARPPAYQPPTLG